MSKRALSTEMEAVDCTTDLSKRKVFKMDIRVLMGKVFSIRDLDDALMNRFSWQEQVNLYMATGLSCVRKVYKRNISLLNTWLALTVAMEQAADEKKRANDYSHTRKRVGYYPTPSSFVNNIEEIKWDCGNGFVPPGVGLFGPKCSLWLRVYDISNYPDEVKYPGDLFISSIRELSMSLIPCDLELFNGCLPNLEKLYIWNNPELERIPEWIPKYSTKLSQVCVESCHNLEDISDRLLQRLGTSEFCLKMHDKFINALTQMDISTSNDSINRLVKSISEGQLKHLFEHMGLDEPVWSLCLDKESTARINSDAKILSKYPTLKIQLVINQFMY